MLVGTILIVGLGASTAYLIPWALLPDAIDADPEKPAGLYSAWMVFTQKICISLALFFFGNLMSLQRLPGGPGHPAARCRPAGDPDVHGPDPRPAGGPRAGGDATLAGTRHRHQGRPADPPSHEAPPLAGTRWAPA